MSPLDIGDGYLPNYILREVLPNLPYRSGKESTGHCTISFGYSRRGARLRSGKR